jgi:phospholipid/cholesterol/gamma-HCH transport system substrate-binding protein
VKFSKEFKVGLVAIVTIAIFIWGFNYLKGLDIFKNYKTFYAIYPRVNGLTEANPVSIHGLNVGQVTRISFTPDMSGNIVVEFTVTTDLPLPKNSVANIYSSDLMGSKAIEIVIGDADIYLDDGDTLVSELEASLKDAVNQQIAPLKNKAEELIGSIDSAVVAIRGVFNRRTRENLRNSIESIRITLKNLERATYTIDTLVSTQKNRLAAILDNVESITSNLRENNENITNIINNFSTISDSLAKAQIPKTFDNINSTISDLAEVVEKVNSGQGTIGLLLNDDKLYNNLQKASNNLNALLEDLQQNPKKYVRFSLF